MESLLSITDILKILPHRYPFLLVDRVVECVPDKRLVAIKNVTVNEPFFTGHFPGAPVMPGVLIVEAMAQASGLLISYNRKTTSSEYLLFAGIENQAKQGSLSPAQAQQLSERYEQLKRDYTRKSEDLAAEARKAYAADTEPLNRKLGDALRKFSSERGINIVIEVGGARESASIFYAAPGLNITDAFIDDYNKANP